MTGPAGTAVPVALLMIEGPLPVADALQLAVQVGQRAAALGDVGLDYSLEKIRIDGLGGVRCSPSARFDDPVAALGRLLMKLTTGRSDSDPATLDDLELEGLVANAVTGDGPDLQVFLEQLEGQAARFPDGSLGNLARRARRIPTQLLQGVAPGHGGGSETAQWIIPTAPRAERQLTPSSAPGRVLPPALPDALPEPIEDDGFDPDEDTELVSRQEAAEWTPSLTPMKLAGGGAPLPTLSSPDVPAPRDANETQTVLLPLESSTVPANVRPPDPEPPPAAPPPAAPSRRRRSPPAAQPVRADQPVDGEANPVLLGIGVAVGAVVVLTIIGGWLVISAM